MLNIQYSRIFKCISVCESTEKTKKRNTLDCFIVTKMYFESTGEGLATCEVSMKAPITYKASKKPNKCKIRTKNECQKYILVQKRKPKSQLS